MSIVRVAENRFQQVAIGTVPGAGIEQFGGRSVLFTTPYFRELWPILRVNFAEDFARFLEVEYRLTGP